MVPAEMHEPSSSSHKQKYLWLVIALLLAYLLLAFVWQDLPLWDFDDAMYLASAQTVHAWMFVHGLTTMPLYALWLRGVGVVFRDPVWCQFASWTMLVMLVTLMPVVAGVKRAWLVALTLLALPYFRIQPYVSLFSAALLLIGAVMLLRGRKFSMAQAAALACVALVVASYARPESAYGVVVAALATILFAVWEKREGDWLRAVLPAVLLAVMMVLVMQHSDMSRSGVAFAQHYNLRAAAHGLIPQQGAWSSEYAYNTFGIDVHANGGRHAMSEFAKASPKLFAAHVIRNMLSPLTVLMVGFTLLVVAWPWMGKRIDDRHIALRPASVYLFLISLPTFGAMILVFPDKHYLQVVVPALLLLAAQFVPESSEKAVWWIASTAVALLAAFGLRQTPMAHGRLTVSHPGLDTIACLREVERDVPVGNDVVFDAVGIRAVYLLKPKTVVTTGALPDWAIVKQQRPGWVVEASANEELSTQLGYVAHACPKVPGLTVYTAQ